MSSVNFFYFGSVSLVILLLTALAVVGKAGSDSGISDPSTLAVPLSSTTTYRDTIGALHVVGDVQNNLTFPIKFVQITATFYDYYHRVAATSYTFSQVDVLRPGERSGFDLIQTDAPQSVYSYALSTSYEKAQVSKLALLNLSIGYSSIDEDGFYHQVGEVTNQGNNATRYVEVLGEFYDINHRIVNVAYTFTNPSDLQPGRTAPFDLTVSSPNAKYIMYESINVQSNDYSLMRNK